MQQRDIYLVIKDSNRTRPWRYDITASPVLPDDQNTPRYSIRGNPSLTWLPVPRSASLRTRTCPNCHKRNTNRCLSSLQKGSTGRRAQSCAFLKVAGSNLLAISSLMMKPKMLFSVTRVWRLLPRDYLDLKKNLTYRLYQKWSHKALNSKTFLGGHAPRPP